MIVQKMLHSFGSFEAKTYFETFAFFKKLLIIVVFTI